MTLGSLYEYAYSLMGRRMGMINGVSDVTVYGSKFAVRIQVDPDILATQQIGIDEIANTIRESNPQKPVGNLYGANKEITINVDGQIKRAAGYEELIVRNNEHALLKIKDLGQALRLPTERQVQSQLLYKGYRNTLRYHRYSKAGRSEHDSSNRRV